MQLFRRVFKITNRQVYEIKEELADEDVRIVLVGKSLGGLISVSTLCYNNK